MFKRIWTTRGIPPRIIPNANDAMKPTMISRLLILMFLKSWTTATIMIAYSVSTDAPCIECSKLIIQAGIRRVVYARSYRLTEGLELLQRAGIELLQIDESQL